MGLRRHLHETTTAVIAAAVLSACSGETATPASSPFHEHFAVIDTVTLEEDGQQQIGQLDFLIEARNGDLLLSDGITSRVRRYDRTGNLVASFGSFGEGPYEFRDIGGIAEDPSGRVHVVDPRLGRVTILGPALEPDTLLHPRPAPKGEVHSFGSGFVAALTPGSRRSAFGVTTDRWESMWTIPAPSPGSASEYPYWNSYASTPVATVNGHIVTAYSLHYPIYLYDRTGALRDTIGSPSTLFRNVPVVARGAFAGPGADQRRKEWLASFDVIAALTGFQDTLLAVTHGHLRSSAASRILEEHRTVDIYKIPDGGKVGEDIRLIPGARVMGGGSKGLYLLVGQPPRDWTLVQALFRRGDADDP